MPDVPERCPRCGAPLEGKNPYLPSYGRYECGSYINDGTETHACAHRQRDAARAEAARYRTQLAVARAAVEYHHKRYEDLQVGVGTVIAAAKEAVSEAKSVCGRFDLREQCRPYLYRGRVCHDCPYELVAQLDQALLRYDAQRGDVIVEEDDGTP